MKPPVAPGGWMELLDREKEWTWGTRISNSLDYSIKRYLKDVTELGRPWSWADRKGERSSSWHFRSVYGRPSKWKTLSVSDQKRLQDLPYFRPSYKYPILTRKEKIKALSDFITANQRLPKQSRPEEQHLYEYRERLKYAMRLNRLTPEETEALSSSGAMSFSDEYRRNSLLSDLRAFVQKHNKWPKHTKDVKECKLCMRLRSRLRKIQNNVPVYITLEDLASIPHFPGLPRQRSKTTVKKKGPHS